MPRLATGILVVLLLALVLSTVVEAKKGKRHVEEKSIGRQKSPSKRHESSVMGKEGKGKRWKEDKLTRGKQNEDKYLELTSANMDKLVRGSRKAETKERFADVKKEDLKTLHKSERVSGEVDDGEEEKWPAICEDIECRSVGFDDESTELESMEEDDPQEECVSMRKVNKPKKNQKCVSDKTVLAHEESERNCNYGL